MNKSDDGRRTAEQLLCEHPEHKHLRVRAKGDLVTLESGPEDDPIPHLRFRRATVQWWYLGDAHAHWPLGKDSLPRDHARAIRHC
ncbi:MAG: hypothetical protein QM765_49700 [Myxococcales bacterium]